MVTGRRWSSADNVSLLKSRIYGVSFEALSEDFGCEPKSCRNQIEKLRLDPDYVELIAQLPAGKIGRARDQVLAKASPAAVIDRKRRDALRFARDDITANFFGDPLKGYSALDRKLEGAR